MPAETTPGTVANLTAGNFVAATNGTQRMYAVHASDLSTDVEAKIAANGNVNGDKVITGRTFALMLANSQTVNVDDELFVTAAGQLTQTGFAGEGQFWANEAVITGAGDNFLISITAK